MKWNQIMFDLWRADVQDKETLAIFRTKLLYLQKIFFGKGEENDVHSIFNQYQELVWNDAVYRTYNEARRISDITNSPKTGLLSFKVRFQRLSFSSQVYPGNFSLHYT